MEDTRIILAGLWVALMLTYLLGDVLRIFSGSFTPGKIMGEEVGEGVWLGMALIMLVPIVMIPLTLTLPFPAIRWTAIVVTALVAVFNLFALPYPNTFDNVLTGVSLIFNAVIAWYAWTWIV